LPAQLHPDPDAGQLRYSGRPVKAEGDGCEWRRRRRQREVAEDQHAVVPHQINYLPRIHWHVLQQRNDVPFPRAGSARRTSSGGTDGL